MAEATTHEILQIALALGEPGMAFSCSWVNTCYVMYCFICYLFVLC